MTSARRNGGIGPGQVARGLRAAALVGLMLPAYATLAYVLMPAVWRRHARLPSEVALPKLSYTAEGIPADPINLAVVGTTGEVLAAMRAAGWTQADRISLRSGLRDAGSVLFDRPYSAAPMSTHFLARLRPQDLAFEQLVGRSPRRRHHVRFWRQGPADAQGRTLWVGAASFDRSVGVSRFTGEVMHHIDPRVDRERDKLVDDLLRARRARSVSWIPDFAAARRGRNGGGDRYETDGRLALLRLLGNETQDSCGRLADPEVAAVAPEREEVSIASIEDVARLAGRVDEHPRAGVGEVDDLAVARTVGHPEGPVEPVRADVDRRGVAALPRLQPEDRAQAGHRLEDTVRKTRAVEVLPPPASRVASEAPPQQLDRLP
jgi:LssY-like putative type I secretion system component LssY